MLRYIGKWAVIRKSSANSKELSRSVAEYEGDAFSLVSLMLHWYHEEKA